MWPTFYNTPTVLSNCDAATGWSVGAATTEFYKEGAGALEYTFRIINSSTYTIGTATDLRNTNIRLWFLSINSPYMYDRDDGVNRAGFSFVLSDGTNTGWYYMLGNDNYAGGWVQLVRSTTIPFDENDGTDPDLSAITTVGIEFNFTSNPKNVVNTWWDLLAYGNGYTITSGSDADPVTWSDIAAADEDLSNGWGVVQYIGGAYQVNGELVFGTGSDYDIFFKDTDEIVLFQDEQVGTSDYTLTIDGGATTTSSFQMGDKVGGRGISGCTLRSVNYVSSSFIISASEGVDVFKIYGSTFTNASSSYLLESGSNREILDTTWSNCGTIYPYSAGMRYCNIINARLSASMYIDSDVFNVIDTSFINPSFAAIAINETGSYPFNALIFAGTDGVDKWDVNNLYSGSIEILATDSNVSYVTNSNAGSYNIINTVYLTVNVEDEATNPIESASVWIATDEPASLRTVLMNEYTDITGVAIQPYNYLGLQDIIVRVRKSSPGDTRYNNVETVGQIDDGGFTVTVVMSEDIIAEP